jgi:hypothetical protein
MRRFALLVALTVCWPVGVKATNPTQQVDATITDLSVTDLSGLSDRELVNYFKKLKVMLGRPGAWNTREGEEIVRRMSRLKSEIDRRSRPKFLRSPRDSFTHDD